MKLSDAAKTALELVREGKIVSNFGTFQVLVADDTWVKATRVTSEAMLELLCLDLVVIDRARELTNGVFVMSVTATPVTKLVGDLTSRLEAYELAMHQLVGTLAEVKNQAVFANRLLDAGEPCDAEVAKILELCEKGVEGVRKL